MHPNTHTHSTSHTPKNYALRAPTTLITSPTASITIQFTLYTHHSPGHHYLIPPASLHPHILTDSCSIFTPHNPPIFYSTALPLPHPPPSPPTTNSTTQPWCSAHGSTLGSYSLSLQPPHTTVIMAKYSTLNSLQNHVIIPKNIRIYIPVHSTNHSHTHRSYSTWTITVCSP